MSLEDNYLLILRKIIVKEQSIEYENLFFLLLKDSIYKISDDRTTADELDTDGFIKYFEDALKRSTQIIDILDEQVDQLEDHIFDQQIPRHFIDIWYALKKSVTKIERFNSRYSKVILDLLKLKLSYFEEMKSSLRSCNEHFLMNFNQSSSLVSKLDTIHNYFTSFKNEKINKNIYLLTILSGVFLPLNLIVGFFGMNTENLIFKDNPEGTRFVLLILVGVFLFFTIGFKFLKFFDNLLLKYGLGRFKMYKLISKKLNQVNKVLDLE
jgi:magnesium transporter